MELPLKRPTGSSAAKVGLERARQVEGMAEVLVEALQLKNDPLAPFPTELPLTMPTRSWWAARVWLEQVGVVEGMAGLLPEALELKNHTLGLFPTELPLNRAHRAIGSQGGAGAGQACGGDSRSPS